MAGHAQLQFVMTECSKIQIRLMGLNYYDGKNIMNIVILKSGTEKKIVGEGVGTHDSEPNHSTTFVVNL